MDGKAVCVPRLLTVKELSELTGITRWRLYEMIRGKTDKKRKDGAAPLPPPPPFLRIGRKFRFPEDGVAQWIRHLTNGNTNNDQENKQ